MYEQEFRHKDELLHFEFCYITIGKSYIIHTS